MKKKKRFIICIVIILALCMNASAESIAHSNVIMPYSASRSFSFELASWSEGYISGVQTTGTTILSRAFAFEKEDSNGRFVFSITDYLGTGQVTYTIVDEQLNIIQSATVHISRSWTSSSMPAGTYYVHISNNTSENISLSMNIYY